MGKRDAFSAGESSLAAGDAAWSLYTIAPSSHALLLLCVLLNNEDGGFGSSHAAKMSARSSLSRREDRRVQQRLL